MGNSRSKRAINRRKVKKKNIGIILDYKINSVCIDCGEHNPFLLEFDHIKSPETDAQTKARNKKFNLGDTDVLESAKERDIIDEIKKCDVRCKNCHSLKERYFANSYPSHREEFLDALEEYFYEIGKTPDWYFGRK